MLSVFLLLPFCSQISEILLFICYFINYTVCSVLTLTIIDTWPPFKFQNGKSVTEFLKKPPSTSPYLIICRRGSGWQTFLACGGNSILETSTTSTGVAALIGSYHLFNFEYPSEAKGAFLFLQEYLLNDFVNQRHSKYAAALVRYQTAAMKNSHSSMASNSAMAVPKWTIDHAKNMRLILLSDYSVRLFCLSVSSYWELLTYMYCMCTANVISAIRGLNSHWYSFLIQAIISTLWMFN